MHINKSEFKRRRIAAVGWFCALLLATHLVWCFLPGFLVQDYWDPQFSKKFVGLKKLLVKNPRRPLWLIMGSSRVEHGLRPGLLKGHLNAEGDPVVYNFGMGGADLFRELISLRRVVEANIRPKRVGIEIVGALLDRPDSFFVVEPTFISRARTNELDIYRSYSNKPQDIRHYWLRSRFDPTFQYQAKMKHRELLWRPIARLFDDDEVRYDQWGWYPVRPAPIPRDDYLKAFEFAKYEYRNDMVPGFKVSDLNRRACREILDFCKKQGLEVFLIRTPESQEFQALYPAVANAAAEAFFNQIKREYHVKMIDARNWIESEGFSDGHHLNATGAEKFTLRFGDELSKLDRTP